MNAFVQDRLCAVGGLTVWYTGGDKKNWRLFVVEEGLQHLFGWLQRKKVNRKVDMAVKKCVQLRSKRLSLCKPSK